MWKSYTLFELDFVPLFLLDWYLNCCCQYFLGDWFLMKYIKIGLSFIDLVFVIESFIYLILSYHWTGYLYITGTYHPGNTRDTCFENYMDVCKIAELFTTANTYMSFSLAFSSTWVILIRSMGEALKALDSEGWSRLSNVKLAPCVNNNNK